MNAPNHGLPASLARIGVVFQKEIRDNLRDRRSIASSLLSTLIGPLVIVIMIVVVGKSLFADVSEKPVRLAVVGSENAPALIAFLRENSVEILPAPANPGEAVRTGELELVLVIDDGYAENLNAGMPAPVHLVLDTSRQSAIVSVERMRGLLDAYNGQIAFLRLMARGVNPSITTPLAIRMTDVATPETQSLLFLNMMPYFVILVVFIGGMSVIIDSTAGERERGSLEPLLINPVARWEFVVGKLLASLPFAVFTVLVTLLAYAATFNLLPLENFLGFRLSLSLWALAGIFLISLPMILLASALQMVVATFTRSFKEAQTYVSFLPLIPSLPGIGLAFLPVKATVWIMLIPTFGQQVLINQLMRSEPVSGLNVAVSTAATLVLTLGLIYLSVRLYQREQIIFGTK